MDFTVRYEPSQDEVARALLQGVRRQYRILFPALTGVLVVCGLAYLCVPTTLHLTGDGYTVQTDRSTATTQWAMFSGVTTTPEFWLFLVDKQFTGFLPRRAFTSEQQAELDAFFAARSSAAAS
ncbi:YcxB family protein [Nonomuraea sp. NPDC049695]|uniref:YcxB family protein n=1 Tax=Nonomuraea sp. NPDC049695 TaxID=3154734 RepID=UPI003436E07C